MVIPSVSISLLVIGLSCNILRQGRLRRYWILWHVLQTTMLSSLLFIMVVYRWGWYSPPIVPPARTRSRVNTHIYLNILHLDFLRHQERNMRPGELQIFWYILHCFLEWMWFTVLCFAVFHCVAMFNCHLLCFCFLLLSTLYFCVLLSICCVSILLCKHVCGLHEPRISPNS